MFHSVYSPSYFSSWDYSKPLVTSLKILTWKTHQTSFQDFWIQGWGTARWLLEKKIGDHNLMKGEIRNRSEGRYVPNMHQDEFDYNSGKKLLNKKRLLHSNRNEGLIIVITILGIREILDSFDSMFLRLISFIQRERQVN